MCQPTVRCYSQGGENCHHSHSRWDVAWSQTYHQIVNKLSKTYSDPASWLEIGYTSRDKTFFMWQFGQGNCAVGCNLATSTQTSELNFLNLLSNWLLLLISHRQSSPKQRSVRAYTTTSAVQHFTVATLHLLQRSQCVASGLGRALVVLFTNFRASNGGIRCGIAALFGLRASLMQSRSCEMSSFQLQGGP